MSTPIVEPADLATYLGADVDQARATMLIRLAQDLCESILGSDLQNPLPLEAESVVLSSAGRGYLNAQGITSETIGTYNIQRPSAGVYLTKSERAALKRIAGRTGAFSVSLLPTEWRATTP